MKLVNENIENILQPKNWNKIKNDLKELSIDQKFNIVEELWNENYMDFALDILRYMGKWKFEDMMNDLIVMKHQERI